MLRDRPLRLAAALAAVLALSACADTERIKPSSHATPVPVPTVKLTVNPAPTTPPAPSESGSAAPSGSASATGGSKAGGNEVKALITNTFDPPSLKVKKGTKVTWTAEGAHSVTSGTDGKEDPKGPMKGPIGFTSYSVTFDKAGTFPYFCIPHVSLGMVGEVVVS
jgi:plastocyanin